MTVNIDSIFYSLSQQSKQWVNATRLQAEDFTVLSEVDFNEAKNTYFKQPYDNDSVCLVVCDAYADNKNRYQLEVSCRSSVEENYVTERWWDNDQLLGIYEVPCLEMTDRHSYNYRAITAFFARMRRPEWTNAVKFVDCHAYQEEDWNVESFLQA